MQDENNTSCRLLTTEITGCLKLTTTGPHFMAGLIMKEKNALCANIRKSRVVVCVFFVWALQLELLFSRLWPACDCSGHLRTDYRMTTWQCRLCWVQKTYTGRTTSLRDSRLHSHPQYQRHCPSLGCWTSSRWHNDWDDLPLPSHRRRLRCTRTPSDDTYQPHQWWRTSSIQPSTTNWCYAGSAHHISI